MIHLIKETIEDIPILHVVAAERHHDALPTVIYYHGFNGEKISSLTLAYKIAEKGYRVVLPDCLYHGERKTGISDTELNLAFWDIVFKNIKEIQVISDYLVQNGYSDKSRIGIGGTSMGGITTYGALMTYDWIKTAAVLMGTPYLTEYAKQLIRVFNETNEYQISDEEKQHVMKQLAPIDPTLHLDMVAERPLLIWHGEDDKVVPYGYSPAFYELMHQQYENKELIRFVSEKGRSHHISNHSMQEAAKWFSEFL